MPYVDGKARRRISWLWLAFTASALSLALAFAVMDRALDRLRALESHHVENVNR